MDPVAGHAASRPDHPAVITSGLVCTYRMFDRRANCLADLMADRGVGPGDRVAVMVPNGARWFEANVATARLGAQLVPLNWHLLGEEITWILTDSDARLLVADHALQTPASEALSRASDCAAVFVDDRFEEELDRATPEPRVTSATGPSRARWPLSPGTGNGSAENRRAAPRRPRRPRRGRPACA